MANCLFCGISSGEVAAPVVYKDEQTLVFLDHRPLFPGHCLVIPRQHVETMGEMAEELISPLFACARAVCRAVEAGLGCEGSFVAVNNRVSQSVPHLHVHVVPRRKKDGLKGFFWPRTQYRDPAEAETVRVSIREAMDRLK